MSCTHSAKKGQSRASKARRLNALEDLTCLKDFTRFVKIHKDFKGSNSSCGAMLPLPLTSPKHLNFWRPMQHLARWLFLPLALAKAAGCWDNSFLINSDGFRLVQVGSSQFWCRSIPRPTALWQTARSARASRRLMYVPLSLRLCWTKPAICPYPKLCLTLSTLCGFCWLCST